MIASSDTVVMPEPFGWETIDLTSAPALPPGEIHIYATLLAPDPDWLDQADATLCPTEKDRASRFRFDEDRYRFQKTRTALRALLGSYLGVGGAQIEFREGPHGKPYLDTEKPDIQFNVSHTKGAAIIAFARDVELGIDIEHARRRVDIEGVGRKVFTQSEQSTIETLGSSSALRQFFRLWTAKEAYLKATGTGLSCDPASFEISFEKRSYAPTEDPESLLPFSLREIETGNQFLVSLAYAAGQALQIRALEFD